jgi:hypothetical protein
MHAITYKPVLHLSKTSRFILVCLLILIAGLLLFPRVAHAESKVFALSCGGKKNHVVIKNSSLSCTVKAGLLTVQGIGTESQAAKAGNPYTDEVEITTVVVNCPTGNIKEPKLGARITNFDCDRPASPKPALRMTVRKQNIDPNPRPAAKNPTVS